MPQVERTGIYRNAKGHAFFLRKGRNAGTDVLASYAYDADAALSPVRAAIAEADNGAPVAVAESEPAEDADGIIDAGDDPPSGAVMRVSTGEESNAEVEAREVSTASFPAAVGERIEPVPVAPGGRRKRRKIETPEDAAPPIETPEDDGGEREDREDAG